MSTQQELEYLLDSDDELPTSYSEILAIPAYQDDERFESIQFHWLDNMQPRTVPESSPSPLGYYNDEFEQNIASLKENETLLIRKGVLSQQDILCIKSIEHLFNTELLLWFINFLIMKDLQSNYNFLTSCLVKDLTEEYSATKTISNVDVKNGVANNYRIFLKTF